MSKFKILALSLMVAGQSATAGEIYTIDDTHSTLGFKVRHMMVTNVTGKFTGMKGTFDIDPGDFTKSKIEGEIETKTVDTGNKDRDDHLRNADFFDVKKYPKMVFKSKKIEKDGERFKITGDLSLHGVTKEITLEAEPITPVVKDPWGKMKRGFSATGKLNRKDFGLTWNKTLDAGGVAVGDEVSLSADFELVQAAAAGKKS